MILPNQGSDDCGNEVRRTRAADLFDICCPKYQKRKNLGGLRLLNVSEQLFSLNLILVGPSNRDKQSAQGGGRKEAQISVDP